MSACAFPSVSIPAIGAWIGTLITFVVHGAALLLRLQRGAWRHIRINIRRD